MTPSASVRFGELNIGNPTSRSTSSSLRYCASASMARGYKDAEGLLADEDLKVLHHNAQFQELIGTLKLMSTPARAGR
jgi:hypothetical protein